MELVNEEYVPHVSDFMKFVPEFFSIVKMSEGAKYFKVSQSDLHPSAIVFNFSHRCIGSIMKFKIKFTLPLLQILSSSIQVLEKLVARRELDFRCPLKILESLESLNVLDLWATAAISVSE
jgi:hypothetical protein